MAEYQVKTQSFEGPLDLLLHLISKAKIDIKDIFVSEITEQYLAYVSEMKQADMEAASEFITMAATLLYIKSRSLFPRISEEDAEDVKETEQQLILRLEEYKQIKEATLRLQEMETQAADHYYKLPEDFSFQEGPLNLEGIGVQELFAVFSELLQSTAEEKTEQPRPRVIQRETYSVRERIEHIRNVLNRERTVKFTDLFEKKATRGCLVATFVALLELISAGKIAATQEKNCGDIYLARREERI